MYAMIYWLSFKYSYIYGVFFAKLINTLFVYPIRLYYKLGCANIFLNKRSK